MTSKEQRAFLGDLIDAGFTVGIVPDHRPGCSPVYYRATMIRPDETPVAFIYFILDDPQTGDPVVITNMTVREEARGKGIGKKILFGFFLVKPTGHGIRATQVQKESEGFWEKCGFVRCLEPNPTNDYIRR